MTAFRIKLSRWAKKKCGFLVFGWKPEKNVSDTEVFSDAVDERAKEVQWLCDEGDDERTFEYERIPFDSYKSNPIDCVSLFVSGGEMYYENSRFISHLRCSEAVISFNYFWLICRQNGELNTKIFCLSKISLMLSIFLFDLNLI